VIPVRKVRKVIQALLVQLDLRAKRVTRVQLDRKVLLALPDRKAQLVLSVRLVLQDQVEVHHHPVVVELCYSMQMEVLWDTH
jgi:hypothetical protein